MTAAPSRAIVCFFSFFFTRWLWVFWFCRFVGKRNPTRFHRGEGGGLRLKYSEENKTRGSRVSSEAMHNSFSFSPSLSNSPNKLTCAKTSQAVCCEVSERGARGAG